MLNDPLGGFVRWVWRQGIRQVLVAVLTGLAPGEVEAQFDDVPVPTEIERLAFMMGEWTVEGTFRTPDVVGNDRRIWYRTRGGGVTSFDGSTWSVFDARSPAADSVLGLASGPVAPFKFTNALDVRFVQDGFVLLADEGRTSGTTSYFYDVTRRTLVAIAIHAPSGAITRSTAPDSGESLVFTGEGTDRRGERVFVRTLEVVDEDHYRIRTDVSFDGGSTWIDDQVVQEVRRR